MRISDWSSDVCSSDLLLVPAFLQAREMTVDAVDVVDDLPPVPAGDRAQAEILLHGQPDEGAAALGDVGDAEPDDVLGRAALGGLGGEEDLARSEERRVGNECVSTCKSRGWSEH